MNISNYAFLKELSQLSFIDKIILYGSRARNDFQARSDIDLAIICPTATDREWAVVMDIIDKADTLLKIDCVRVDSLASTSQLKQSIEKEGIVLYEK